MISIDSFGRIYSPIIPSTLDKDKYDIRRSICALSAEMK